MILIKYSNRDRARRSALRRPIHLFFELRNRGSDFLYRDELETWAAAEERLASLATACSCGSHAAAKALGVNQSTVHRRIAELESRTGLTLVRRHPSGYGSSTNH